MLLSQKWDLFLVGGATLLFFAVAWLFIPVTTPIDSWAWAAYYIAFFINYPHFMASYQLLYGNQREQLLKNWRHFVAAFVVPVLLVGVMAYGLLFQSARVFDFLVQLLFFSVGWHYIKQTYGVMIVSSVQHGAYFSSLEKIVLRLNLYAVWGLSWINFNLGSGELVFYSVRYQPLGFPFWLLDATHWAFAATTLAFFGLVIKRVLIDGAKAPPLLAFLALFGMYIWYFPRWGHPVFAYFIPMLHGLQYLVFVLAFHKNKTAIEAPGVAFFKKPFLKLWILTGIFGAIGFYWAPTLLDQHVNYDRVLGATVFMACFQIFLNVHHYFIDAAIWKSSNPDVKRYLFYSKRQGLV